MKTLLSVWLGLARCYNVILGLLSTSPTVLQSVPVQQKYYNLSWAKHHSVTLAASILYLLFSSGPSQGNKEKFLNPSVRTKSDIIFYLSNPRNIKSTTWLTWVFEGLLQLTVTVWHNIFCVTCNRSSVTLTLLRLIITLVIAYNDQTAVWSHQITAGPASS